MSRQRVAWWATTVAVTGLSYLYVGWWNLLIPIGAYLGAWSVAIDLTKEQGKP